MHIPDGLLDPKMSAGMAGAAALAVAFCVAKVRQAVTAVVKSGALAAVGAGANNVVSGGKRVLTKLGEKKIYEMGMIASLLFAAQMFNFPIGQGTSGHLIGGVLAAVLLGPFAGTVVIAVVLMVQSFFFADGGVLALGANIVNMAVVGSLCCYYIYFYAKKYIPEWAAIAASSWISVMAAASLCSLQIGLSGAFPVMTVFSMMLKAHAVIGVAEALITVALVNIYRNMKGDHQEE